MFSSEVLKPSKSSISVGINFFQTSVNVGILTSSPESWIPQWILSGESFLEGFQLTLSRSIRDSLYVATMAYGMYLLKKLILESRNDTLLRGLQNGYGRCSQAWPQMHHVRLHQSSWWPGTLWMNGNILKGIFFFWAVALNSELKTFSEFLLSRY